MSSFNRKVVLITGGTSGIGLALAAAFQQQGARVAVCGRSQQRLQAFEAMYPQALAIQADITDPGAQATVLEAVARRFGPLDILVSNAGAMVEHGFGADAASAKFTRETIDPAALSADIALNLTAPIQLTAAALSRFPELGAIVFVTSGYALAPPRRSPTYGAGKAGLRAFAKALRRRVGPKVHVLEVLPPAVDTPATAELNVKKVAAETVAEDTLKALAHRRDEAFIGAVRLLPTLLRIAPRMIEKSVAEG